MMIISIITMLIMIKNMIMTIIENFVLELMEQKNNNKLKNF